MGDIVDFFSKRKYGELVTSEEIDEQVGEEGIFLGALTEPMKEELHSTMELLNTRAQQINSLMEEHHRIMDGYSMLILGALAYLGKDLDDFDPYTHEFYVDDNAKAWLRERVGYTPEEP